jgi:hypothetical protein
MCFRKRIVKILINNLFQNKKLKKEVWGRVLSFYSCKFAGSSAGRRVRKRINA